MRTLYSSDAYPFCRRLSSPLVLAAYALLAATTLPATQAHAGPAPKVQVCHIPPGNPANFHTIRVSENALSKHLAHGDIAGPCNDVCAVLCDDGNACTIDDTGDCENSGCPTTPEAVDCNDSNACTADSCEPTTGCEYTALTGTTCAVDSPDTCEESTGVCDSAGSCDPDRTAGCCLSTTECQAWDTNLCTNEECIETACVTTSTVVCETDACHISVCTPSDGTCTEPEPVVCEELECHDNGCDPVTGCFSDPIEGCCISDAECQDGNNCTTDVCYGIDGCVSTPCASGDACNVLVDCDEFTCEPTTVPETCEDDGNLCTAESCVDGLGCMSDPIVCPDGELCDADTGACVPTCFTMRDAAGSGDSIQACVDLCDLIAGCDPGVCSQKFQNATLVNDCLINGNLASCDAVDDFGRTFCSNICAAPECQTPGADAFVLTGQVNDSITLGAGQPNETTITSVEGVDHGGPSRSSAWIAAYDSGRQLQWAASIVPGYADGDGWAGIYASDFDDTGSIYVAIRANVYPGALTLKSADGTAIVYAPPLDTEFSSYGIAKISTSGVWQWYAPLEPDTGTGGGTYVRIAAVSVEGSRVYVTGVEGITQAGRSLRFSNQGGITFPVSDYPVHPFIILDANTGAYVGHRVDGVALAGPESYVTRHVTTTTPTVGATGVTGWYDGSTGFGHHMNVAANFGSPDQLVLPDMDTAGLLARRDLDGNLMWAFMVNDNNAPTSNAGYSMIGGALETGDGAIFFGGAEGFGAPEFHHAGGVQAMSPFADGTRSQYLARYTEDGFLVWLSTIRTGGMATGLSIGRPENTSALYDPVDDRVYIAYNRPPELPVIVPYLGTLYWDDAILFGEGEPTEELFSHFYYGPAFPRPADAIVILAAFDGADGSLLWTTSHRRIESVPGISQDPDKLLVQLGPGGLYLDGQGGIVMMLESGPGPTVTNYEDNGTPQPVTYPSFTMSAVRHSVTDGSVLCISDLESLALTSGDRTEITGSLTVK